MKSILLATLLALLPGGERERGLQLYREGRFAEAAAAFRAAVAEDGDSAELQWNLALASWRAGDLAAAETAAEKYAALDRGARVDLHAGLLGAVRHDEAMALQAQADAAGGQPPADGAQPADPLPLLEAAKKKAETARDHFVRGAGASASPELRRNLERSLRTIAELERRIEELKKQRESQKSDKPQDGDDKKPQDDKSDKQDKQDGQQKPDDKPQGEPQQEPKPGEQKPDDPQQQPGEPKPGEGEGKPEPQAGDGKEPPEPKAQAGEQKPQDGKQGEAKPEPQPGQEPPPEPKQQTPRQDAPGEAAEGRELTPEQAQRLLEQLRDLDDKQRAIRARSKSGRRPVERDW
jgi:hypothetical protein